MSLEEFFDHLPFPPDHFQMEAIRAIQEDRSVVVTAPTGAGKTLVAEAAVDLALQRGRRAFYTTPIKALSNQKYGDFVAHYGAGRVGLLTGDNAINGEADVVVMTAEVLRNMIYARERALDRLEFVILDEVHYLQDPFRGAVWEEIIIHLSRAVRLVCLSATVANPDEFTAWITARRGPTRLVLEEHRPVPLESLYLLKDRHRRDELRVRLLPTFHEEEGRRPNREIARILTRGRGRSRRFVTPRRNEVLEVLKAGGMLPAIYFIFSRAGCESAAQQMVEDRVRLTTPEEAERIRQYTELRTGHLGEADLAVLGYGRWLAQLETGVAPHHAGMVPAFKETVEELFARGLIRLVFATETLALGINMPAKTVVLENLSKFTGEGHELLQPGDYTQLTGRAGRRGIDTVGFGVVLHSPYVPFDRVAEIAAAGTHPLRSSFRPTYNMAVNLVANYPRESAEELLQASFAQFQKQQGAEKLRETLSRNEEALAGYREAAACDRGDVWAYLERSQAGGGSLPGRRQVMQEFARRARAGDVFEVPSGRHAGRRVMLARGQTTEPRMLLASEEGELARVRPEELPPGTTRIGWVELPAPFEPGDPEYVRAVARRAGQIEPDDRSGTAGEEPDRPALDPVATCPDLEDHLRWARRARRMEGEVERLRSRMARIGKDLLEAFHAILDLLEDWGYTEGWSLTGKGRRLRFIYNELDLLLTEAVERGLLAGLDAPGVAAFASAFVYEARSGVEPGAWPSADLAERGGVLAEMATELQKAEADRGIPASRMPDPGFSELAYRWVAGEDLEEILGEGDLAAGDFVRNCRQLLDLLRQIRDALPDLALNADQAVRSMDRGVVAVGGIL